MSSSRPHKTIEKLKYDSYDPFLSLQCKKCGEAIDSKDVNINKTIAKCNHCGSIFTFEDEVFFQNKRGRPEYIMPPGTEVLTLLSSMEIELDWFKSMKRSNIAFETMFTVLWNVITLVILVTMIMAGQGGIIIFLIAHLASGLGLAYNLMAKFINKTTINVDAEYLRITHGPLKTMRRNIEIRKDNIKQFYVTEYSTNASKNGEPIKAYGLFAILNNNKRVRIIKDSNKETTQYLEQELENYLKIVDEPVKGEML